MSAVKLPGIELTLGSTAYIVPPLNVAAVKQHRETIATLLSAGTPDIETVSKLLHAALARNYTGITPEQVDDMVDFANMVPVLDAVMNVSGLAAQMGELGRRTQAMANPSATLAA